MKYPLKERIGKPELLVGREKEFRMFGRWIYNIPETLSKSRVILARRKSGKTSFVQRIFNRLCNENGDVIPFYFDVDRNNIWYPLFAIDYFRKFASQYISFLERAETLVREPLSLEEIREYGLSKSMRSLIRDVDSILHDQKEGWNDLIWKTAYHAPHRYTAVLYTRFLVILDDFQNLSQCVYPDPLFQTFPIEILLGSYHSLSESKIAPMLVTGSYVGLLLEIAGKHLEAGRLSNTIHYALHHRGGRPGSRI